ncbi:hypothetical protein [Mycetocola zhujimingii]|uniref:hypothetical protein n=1 Tax=Mycetocola zhujimingii TaxID=2079792 RepID=UPI0018E0995B|nr:hypothetical protein [Mycetocola zhujimingii]
MRVELRDVSKGRKGRALPETSLSFETGEAILAAAETEQRPTVLGLLASGRMRPDAGTITIDGEANRALMRRRIALVDAPDVSDPDSNVLFAGVVAEQLMFAGHHSNPVAARRWLASYGMKELATTPISDIPPEARLRALCELAVLRSGVTGLVVVSPDRHGGHPLVWWRLAQDFASRDFAVLMIAGRASEWTIQHEHDIKEIGKSEGDLRALGMLEERAGAWAQSGGTPLPEVEGHDRQSRKAIEGQS